MKRLVLLGFLAVATGAFGQNLVLNPGFETGDMTSWTVVNLGSFSGVTGAGGPGTNHSGDWHFRMGATSEAGQSDFYQDIATVIGNTYNVSYWAYDMDTATTSAGMTITFGGTQVGPSRPAAAYTQYGGDFVATAAVTRLEVKGWELTQYINVDDFDVHNVVPEPATLAVLGLGAAAMIRRRKK